MAWYALQVYSGYEHKVAESIQTQAQREGLEDAVCQSLIPSEEVTEIRQGRKNTRQRKFLPGYVMLDLEMSDELHLMVRNLPKVIGFLSAGGQPLSISPKEAAQLVARVAEGSARLRPSIVFDIGEEVRVSDGPFSSFNGLVEEVDEERARLKVSVSIFGRPTPVELEYGQVEKV